MWMHSYSYGSFFLLLGLICVVLCMGFWFRDITYEAMNVAYLNLTIYWKILRTFSTRLSNNIKDYQ